MHPPDDRVLRLGVLSTARIGVEKVIPGIAGCRRAVVTAIASRDADAAAAAARRLGIPRAHGSYEALLADPEVDAVYIPLPNHLHLPWTVAAARAGKHVLCEKPLALTAADARVAAEACRAGGVVLMEAFMYRLHPSWQAVRELVAGGRIGRLAAIHTSFAYYNDDPGNIRNIAAVGGGALYDIGCYAVNLSRMLFGGEPDTVQATLVRDSVSGVDTRVSAILGFGDGVATFTVGTRMEPDQRVDILGTGGRIHVPIPFNIPPDRPTRIDVVAGGDPPVSPGVEIVTVATADPYAVEVDAFAAAILDGTPVPVPPMDAIANLAVIESLFAAAEASAGRRA